MRRMLFVALAVFLMLPLAARADVFHTVSTFTFTGVTNDFNGTPGAVNGTVDVDVTAGDFYAINAAFTSTDGNFTFTTTPASGNEGSFLGDGYVGFFDTTSGGIDAQLAMLLAPASLVGYTGGGLCTDAAACNNIVSTVYVVGTTDGTTGFKFETGDLTFGGSRQVDFGSNVTPEPSSLVLMGTGLLGTVGAFRRRMKR